MNLIKRAILAAVLMAGITPVFAQAPAPVPALPDTERRTSYSISASTCACAINFQYYQDSTDYQNAVEVFLNGVKVTYNDAAFGWTITVPTGSLSTRARPISDAVLTFNSVQTGTVQIVGAQRPRRLTEVSESRGVAARDFNQFANTITAELREVWDRFLRTPRVPAGETLALLPPLSGRASMNACFDSGGNLAPCVGLSSGSIAAGPGIQFSGTNPTTISVAVAANPTTVAISSRAVAQTLDLHAFGVITTGGYAAPGDGGGATFKNVGSAVFQDTYINNSSSPPTLVGGSGYVNGTYLGVALGGGVGVGCAGAVTVAGNVVTAVSLAVPCAGYKVGDVLSTLNSSIGGSGSGFSWTVTAISTPQASFTDSVGTNFQFVTDQAGVANILQFGTKGDWNGSDAAATNGSAAIWSAASWASFQVGASAAQVYGNLVLFPRGAYMTCGVWNGTIYNVPVPQGVRFSGVGVGGTTLVQCATDASGTHYIELCDSNAKVGQFGCKIENMTINLLQVTGSTSGFAAIYSNSGQQFALGERLEIDAGLRSCIKYELGKGGAANDIWADIDCEQSQGAANAGFSLNSPSTQHYILHSTIGCAGTGCSTAINHTNGRLIVDGLDVENFNFGLIQNVSTSGNVSAYRNVQQNSNNCTAAVQLANTNTAGNILFENVATACPVTIQNGQSGGINFTGTTIVKQITCVSGACN